MINWRVILLSVPLCAAALPAIGQQAVDEGFARFGGPDVVEAQLEEDARPKPALFELEFLEPYFAMKDRLRERIGLSFSIDYSAVYFTGRGRPTPDAEDEGSGGMVRLFGAWELTPSGSGALVYKVEHRHAYGAIPPSALGFELGYVGLLAPPFSDQGFRLTNLYWRQRFAGGRFALIGGFLDVTDYVDTFALGSPWMHFTNFTFSTGSAAIPTPNDATFGVAAAGFVNQNIYILAGLTNANSDPTDPFDGVESFFEDRELFKSVEIGWTTSQSRMFHDNVHLTFWHVDEREEAQVPDGWGVAFSVVRSLDDHWMPFVRGGFSKDGGALLEASVSAGFGYQRMAGGDLLGVGFNWGRPEDSSFGPDLDDQYGIELFYRLQIAKQIALTPDVQVLFNPALNPAEDTLWLFGLRARIAL